MRRADATLTCLRSTLKFCFGRERRQVCRSRTPLPHCSWAAPSGPEALSVLERGEKVPTRPQLFTMAKTCHRPLLVLYLPEPPKRANRGEDFHILPPEHRQGGAGALDTLVRDGHVRQQSVRIVLEEAQVHPFVGSISLQAHDQQRLDELRWRYPNRCRSVIFVDDVRTPFHRGGFFLVNLIATQPVRLPPPSHFSWPLRQ